MAKSKQQKREEALARKRQDYNYHLGVYMKTQPGGEEYRAEVARVGTTVAEKFRLNGMRVFCKYLKEAQLDMHGNPVSPEVERPKRFVTHSRSGSSISDYLESCDRGF